MDLERLLPNQVDLERLVIGVVMIHAPAYLDASQIISGSDFYLGAHRLIWGAIGGLQSAQKPFDLQSVRAELAAAGQLEACGGLAYLANMITGVAVATSIRHYAELIREAAVRRAIIQAANEAMTMAYEAEAAPQKVIDGLQQFILGIPQVGRRGFVPVAEYANAAYQQIDEVSHHRRTVTGLDTGLRTLNRYTQGLQPGSLSLIAGRPGHGKSSLAQNIVDHSVLRRGRRVGVFSLEMSGLEVAKRSICSEAPLDSYAIPAGGLNWFRIQEVCQSLSSAALWIDESSGLSITQLQTRARKLALEHKIEFLVVDYLQLMSGTGKKGQNREGEIREISSGLKALAKELNIPILALSQLNREMEKTGRKPILSDLRESGSLEQDADLVLFIWREDMRDPRPENEGKACLALAKNRFGRSGIEIPLHFEREYCRFREVEILIDISLPLV